MVRDGGAIVSDTALPEERHRIILERLRRTGRVLAVDLAKEFETSDDTIRRDLRELAAAGLCRRVYGGALQADERQIDLRTREGIATEEKLALARCCTKLVRSTVASGGLLFLDAGSTNMAIALALPDDMELTVATNSPRIAAALLELSGISVVALGGKVDNRSGAALGSWTLEQLRHLRPDLTFLGACSLDVENGVSAFDPEEAELKRRVAALSRATATAITADKLGRVAPYHVLPAASLNHLVVIEADPSSDITALEAAGVVVHRAEHRSAKD